MHGRKDYIRDLYKSSIEYFASGDTVYKEVFQNTLGTYKIQLCNYMIDDEGFYKT